MDIIQFVGNTILGYSGYVIETVRDVSDIQTVNRLVSGSDSFFMPKKANVSKYTEMFGVLERNVNLYSYFFKLVKLIPINSSNGRVFIVTLKRDNTIPDSDVLVKVALDKVADSLSYEYYIGTRLNRLRMEDKTPCFSLMYGRMKCGMSPMLLNDRLTTPELERVDLCDKNIKYNRLHLVYEYIRNVNTKRVTSFHSYIERILDLSKGTESTQDMESKLFMLERNIINILIILMYSLQTAYDSCKFTHYDLHLSNVLVVELDSPEKVRVHIGDDDYTIVTSVMPYIIDYGRCYVTPDSVVSSDPDGKFQDYEEDHEFDTFKEFQDKLYGGDLFIQKSKSSLRHAQLQMTIFLQKYLYGKTVYSDRAGKLYVKRGDQSNYDIYDDTPETKDMRRLIIDSIYNRNTVSRSRNWTEYVIEDQQLTLINRYNMGVTPNRPNSRYDFFKFVKSTISELVRLAAVANVELKYYEMWDDLNVQLDIEYPFYDTSFLSLPCEYHITDYIPESRVEMGVWGHWLKSAADVGRVLYRCIKDDTVSEPGVRVHQIGGKVGLESNRKIEKGLFDGRKEQLRKFGKDTTIDTTIDTTMETKMEDFSTKRNLVNDFVRVDDVGPIYIKYTETELLRKIKEKTPRKSIKFGTPIVDRGPSYDGPR